MKSYYNNNLKTNRHKNVDSLHFHFNSVDILLRRNVREKKVMRASGPAEAKYRIEIASRCVEVERNYK
jgi:hypothetical protein